MKLSITKKIGVLLMLPACDALVSIGVFYWFLAGTSIDVTFIDIAGRQRMVSEQPFNWAHMVGPMWGRKKTARGCLISFMGLRGL